MTPDLRLSPETAEAAWFRILLSLFFGWILFVVGVFLEFANVFLFSTLFFIFVGILLYLFVDALLFLFTHGDDGLEQHTHIIVGVVFALLLNMVIFYGVVSLALI